MKPRDLFGVGVRLLGVWLATSSLLNLYDFFSRRFDNLESKLSLSNNVPYGTYDYGIYAIINAALAWYFLFHTEHLVRWSYGEVRERLTEAPLARQDRPESVAKVERVEDEARESN